MMNDRNEEPEFCFDFDYEGRYLNSFDNEGDPTLGFEDVLTEVMDYDPPPPPPIHEVDPVSLDDVPRVVSQGLAEAYLPLIDVDLSKEADVGQLFRENQLRTVNIMSQCRIITLNGNNEYRLPSLCSKENEIYYTPEKLPSVLVYLGFYTPTALFTKNGIITMTGGSSLEEIQVCMTYCCQKLLFILQHVYPKRKFALVGFRICNKVCKARLMGYKINIPHFVDRARDAGYVVSYNPDQIHMAYMWLGEEFPRSLLVSVAAKGGIVILGFTHTSHARTVAKILSRILETSLRPVLPIGPVSKQLTPEEEILKKRKKKRKKIKQWGMESF